MSDRIENLPCELDCVGFYVTAGDVRNGWIGRATVVDRLRRDAPKRPPGNRALVLALADRLEKELGDE